MTKLVEEVPLQVKANSIENAFSKMALEMFNVVVNTEEVDLVVTKTIIIRSRDLKHLLCQFLKRLFDLANNELFVLSAVKSLTVEKIGTEYMLNSILIGDKMKPEYKVKDLIKQVTDRNLEVKESMEGTFAQINLVIERRNDEK